MARANGLIVVVCCLLASTSWAQSKVRRGEAKPAVIGSEVPDYTGNTLDQGKLHPLVESGANWLLKTQQADGGWVPRRMGIGALGLNVAAAKSDYSTTAMAGLALVRAGASPRDRKIKEPLRSAIAFVAKEAAAKPAGEPRGFGLGAGIDMPSEPSYKLGPLAGPAHATQFLARVLPMLEPEDELRKPVLDALKVTVETLEKADHAFLKSFGRADDGSYKTTAPAIDAKMPASFSPTHHVLIALTALETAQAAGLEVNPKVLDKLRAMLAELVDPRTGAIDQAKVMSIELYSFSSAMRSSAVVSRAAAEICGPNAAKLDAKGIVATLSAKVDDELAVADLTHNIAVSHALTKRLVAGDRTLLDGFGNHGGEELLSYLIISEALVLAGESTVHETWKAGLAERLARLQNADGSWTGLHCITDSVYMTAAAVQSLTADRDAPLLVAIAKRKAESSK